MIKNAAGSKNFRLSTAAFLPLKYKAFKSAQSSAIPRQTGCILNMERKITAAKKARFTAG